MGKMGSGDYVGLQRAVREPDQLKHQSTLLLLVMHTNRKTQKMHCGLVDLRRTSAEIHQMGRECDL